MKQNNAVAFGPLFIVLLVVISLAVPFPALAEKFSIVVLPDTQFYSKDNPSIFEAQTQWIERNREKENIIYVAHLGDIVDSNCTSGATEWGRADTAMKTLDDARIPYGILPGNHDYDPGNPCSSTTVNYNNGFPAASVDGFGRARFSYLGINYGSQDGTTNDNNYTLFEDSGIKFIAINLAYTTDPSTEILDWADGLLRTHFDRHAIITSHFILEDNSSTRDDDGQIVFGKPGRQIFDRLKDHANLFLMLSGHRRGEAWRIEKRIGMNDVHVLLSNYQDIQIQQGETPDFGELTPFSPGNSGLMRIMRFDTAKCMVSVTTFSPINGTILESTRLVDQADKDTNKLMTQTTASNISFPFKPLQIPCAPSNLRISAQWD